MNWDPEQIALVESRLTLIKQLIEAKDYFKGHDKIINLPERYWTHPYKNYDALRNYLALTCFDILGQPNEWVDFNSWLRSKRKKKERDKIVLENYNPNHSQFILAINNEYNKIYGTKNSFYRFIREILNENNRQKLFNSIRTSKQISPRIIKVGTTIEAMGQGIELPIERKEQFLFEIRNSFTHKGISIGNCSGGIFDNEKPRFFPPDRTPKWGFSGIHKKIINGDIITFSVRQWPFILIEIIESTINDSKKTNDNKV